MQLKRENTVGELTPEIVALAPAWAFYGKGWLDVRTIKDIHLVANNDDSESPTWLWGDGFGRERYGHYTTCYPCCLHEDGTIERLGE